MKPILENWRGFLKEGVDPRIQKQIDRLLTFPGLNIEIKPTKAYASKAMVIKYSGGMGDAPDGVVEMMEPTKYDSGPCNDSWVVIIAEADTGWGPLLYEVALEWASQHGNGLTSDRRMVSRYAYPVWAKYLKRGDVDADQLDVHHDPEHPFGDLPPQLTPDNPDDDCAQDISVDNAGPEGWMDEPTAKAYRKDNSEVMDALRAAGRLVER